ncbi:MAG: response regulator [Anaerolineae bacterium]|nr:response regulator [Anaerolineae bacterium]
MNTDAAQPCILIVDDNVPNLRLMADYLESCQYRVLAAQDGEDALVIARNTQPDLVLLDVMLPGIDGFEICRRLKALPETKDIPVIFMTILEAVDQKLEGFQVGAVDYVTKPFQKEEVLARIDTQLRLKALTEHLEHEVQARTLELTAAMAQLQQEIVERERMSARITHLNAVLRAIRNVNQLIVRATDQSALLQTGCQTLIETRGYESAWIIMADANRNPAQTFQAGEAASQDALVNQTALGKWPPWIQQILDSSGESNEMETGIQGTICPHNGSGRLAARLQHGTTVYGVLVVSLLPVLLEDDEERDLLWEVAQDIAYALANLAQEQQRRQIEVEREQLLVQLREQVQRIQQIIDTVPEGVLLLDAQGYVALANPVARNDLLVLAEAQEDMPITHLGNHPLADLLRAPVTRGLWHEIQVENRIYEVIARPVMHDAAIGDWVLVLNDVTRQREIEHSIQRQERLAAVGQLAAGIAHDFNNIIAVIMLYAQMLSRSSNLSARERERTNIIYQQSQHATNLIQQILDFSRRSILERQPLDLLPLLKEQLKLLYRTLPENIRIKFTHDEESYLIHADPTRMQQMLMNLVVNARDAMPNGGELRITLSHETALPDTPSSASSKSDGSNEWVCLQVADTGTGIPPAVLPHIYEPFFTTKAPGSGSGLGLAQVHGIVGAHEGYIDVQTGIGSGTTFSIYFPLLPPSSLFDSEKPGVPPLFVGHGELILVVEDNLAARQALIESLEFLQYRTLVAANGQEALNILAQHSQEVSLIMSDMVMPEMGGRILLQTLQARGVEIPVILLTGHPLTRELEDMRALGANTPVVEWLLKPYSLDQLAEMVARVMAS